MEKASEVGRSRQPCQGCKRFNYKGKRHTDTGYGGIWCQQCQSTGYRNFAKTITLPPDSTDDDESALERC